jgi:hypothetical protein
MSAYGHCDMLTCQQHTHTHTPRASWEQLRQSQTLPSARTESQLPWSGHECPPFIPESIRPSVVSQRIKLVVILKDSDNFHLLCHLLLTFQIIFNVYFQKLMKYLIGIFILFMGTYRFIWRRNVIFLVRIYPIYEPFILVYFLALLAGYTIRQCRDSPCMTHDVFSKFTWNYHNEIPWLMNVC